jgi:hypothetical protein
LLLACGVWVSSLPHGTTLAPHHTSLPRCFVFFLVVGAVNEVDIVYSSNAAIYDLLLDQEIPECVPTRGRGVWCGGSIYCPPPPRPQTAR